VNRDNFDFVAELYMKLPQYTLKSTREWQRQNITIQYLPQEHPDKAFKIFSDH
jgi:hypothetical protein